MSAPPQPPPPIPHDHPLRAFYEQQRRGLQIQLAALDRALGYGGTAKERRARARGWPNEDAGGYKAAS